MIYLSQRGLPLRRRSFRLPKLRVRKDWFSGLHDIHTTPFKRHSHKMVEHDDNDDVEESEPEGAGSSSKGAAGGGAGRASEQSAEFGGDIGAHGGLSADAEASFGLFAADENDEDDELFEEDGESVFGLGERGEEDAEPRLAKWAELYEDAAAQRELWEAGYLHVDAHALSTPTLADVDGDGSLELIVAVSYFIEEESAARLARHGLVIDKSMYVAGGVLALDPVKGTIKWSVHLDLTTELTKLRAYIYSAVTVVDLDGDGSMEVVVGTSMGFLYVLSGKDGKLRDGFPVQMNEIQAQVVAADVDGDGALELIAADSAGSVAAWRSDGSPVWEVQTSGLCAQGVTLVNGLRGDGSVQVVVPTVAGLVHLLEGKTGAEVAPFPLRTDGRIMSAALVLQLTPLAKGRVTERSGAAAAAAAAAYDDEASEPHLAFTSYDGHLYVVHARTGCYERVDIGEHSYTQVLADDLTGNGKMDLLLSTMNGNLYCFETQTPYKPLRAWRSQSQGRNVWQQREGFQGVVIEGQGSRHESRALSGATFDLDFTIHDYRSAPSKRWHRVEVRLGRGALLLNKTYHLETPRADGGGGSSPMRRPPTPHRETLRCPTERAEGLLTVSMVNEHGQYFEDAVAVTFNEGFEQVLKWVALMPFAAAVAAVVGASLPGAARVRLPI